MSHGDVDQRSVHVLGHMSGVPADVEVRAVFQPRIKLGTVFAQALLYIDFLGGIARKGEVELVQYAALQCGLPFGLVEKILAEMAIAKEQPVASSGRVFLTLLHERAERRHAGSRADHDDVARRIGR